VVWFRLEATVQRHLGERAVPAPIGRHREQAAQVGTDVGGNANDRIE